MTESIIRTYSLPLGFRATFCWRDAHPRIERHPHFPRIEKRRAWRKFVAAYQAARRDFHQDIAAIVGGNYRRMKSRMIKMFGQDVKGSPRLTVFCEFPKLAEGGIDRIKEWIGKATQPRMIVIDTLSMVRVSMKRNDTQFQADYDAVKDLRTLAAEHHVAIVLVHHLRKADADDPFDTVNATLGLTAAVDSILIIKREASGNFTLHGRGRDLSGLEKALAFNPANCTWSVLGEAREVTQSSDRAAIVAALEETGEEMTLAGITAATGIKGVKLRLLLARMAKVGEVGKAARGRYRAPEPRA